jgi:hypothetical protein
MFYVLCIAFLRDSIRNLNKIASVKLLRHIVHSTHIIVRMSFYVSKKLHSSENMYTAFLAYNYGI